MIGDYFAGKTLPPTDRFDILVELLDTTPAERRRLATARDRVEELRRSHRNYNTPVRSRTTATPWTGTAERNPTRLLVFPSDASAVDDRRDTEGPFLDIARRVVWATLTMVDSANRPWSRVVHPLWEHRTDGLTGWVFARSSRLRRSSVLHSRFVSLSYWHPNHDTAVAQCEASWADERERRRGWLLALHTPPPLGYDPATIWPAGVDSPDCELLRLHPWWLMSAPGADGRTSTIWTSDR